MRVFVSLEDWGTDPAANRSSTTILANQAIDVRVGRDHVGSDGRAARAVRAVEAAPGQWVMANLSLTPSAAAGCAPFPKDVAPLNCADDASQGACFVCGGTLTVWLNSSDAAAEVWVDQVFLQPGAWGRFRGLPMHRAPAEKLLAMGVRMVRYGGTFTETQYGLWEEYVLMLRMPLIQSAL